MSRYDWIKVITLEFRLLIDQITEEVAGKMNMPAASRPEISTAELAKALEYSMLNPDMSREHTNIVSGLVFGGSRQCLHFLSKAGVSLLQS